MTNHPYPRQGCDCRGRRRPGRRGRRMCLLSPPAAVDKTCARSARLRCSQAAGRCCSRAALRPWPVYGTGLQICNGRCILAGPLPGPRRAWGMGHGLRDFDGSSCKGVRRVWEQSPAGNARDLFCWQVLCFRVLWYSGGREVPRVNSAQAPR